MFVRKELKYDFNALEPFIDYATMDEHYNAHYKKYMENLNEAIVEDGVENLTIEGIIKRVISIGSKKLRNNAGGFYNHQLYFDNISPNNNAYENAGADLKALIEKDFGSFQQFKANFRSAGLDVFGSGWVWLVLIGDKLKIVKTKNQDNPLMSCNCKILLGMDVWEHAYYLKHKADRKSYIDDFFKVIDWKIVSERV
jgi:Fe-Mn family superoxide dismutase